MGQATNTNGVNADKILVFIPAYNCAPQIGRVLRKLNNVPAGTFAEALVLDNRSTDGTGDAAAAVLPEVTSLPLTIARNQANYGLGGSHKTAFAYAASNGFTHVVVLHGDDQGNILDLLPVLAAGKHRTLDACLGSRFMRGSRTPGYSLFRLVGNRAFNLLFSAASQRLVTDLGSGLNLFGKAVFTDPDVARYSDDLRFNCYLLLGLADRKRSFSFFPITWTEEDQISNVKIYSQAIKTLGIVRQYVLSRKLFRTGEHRSAPHERYVFDVIASSHTPGTTR